MMSSGVHRCLRRLGRLATPITAGSAAVVVLLVGANAFGEPTSHTPSLPAPSAPVEEEVLVLPPRAPESQHVRDSREGVPDMPAMRPFDHRRHESLSCRQCHGTGEQHRTTVVRTARDCAACHHDPDRSGTCGDCHRPSELPPPGPVAHPMALTVWESARMRDLPFAHATHAALSCEDCHRAPVSLARSRECTACHADHHRPEASCISCHPATEPTVHRAESHLSCASAGCHAPGAAPALSRNLCVMCHMQQTNHEPGGDCVTCHHIPDRAAAWSGSEVPVAPGWSGGR